MAGYNGYSMSNNAVLAYDNGEKPYSKWTKADIMEVIAEYMTEEFYNSAKRLTVSELRSLFLRWSSWHHTSSMYNRTDFYICYPDAVFLEDIDAVIAQRKPKADKPKAVKALVRYGEWEGTRKHPKLVEREAYAIIIGNWAYLAEGKKRTDGKHFRIITTYPKAPKGTADTFKEIERRLS